MPKCHKCGGWVFQNGEDLTCLQCGKVIYANKSEFAGVDQFIFDVVRSEASSTRFEMQERRNLPK